MDLLLIAERQLADALIALGERHSDELDIGFTGTRLAAWSEEHIRVLSKLTGRPLNAEAALASCLPVLAPAAETHPLLEDLQNAWLLAQSVHLRWVVLGQAARVLCDSTLESVCANLGAETDRQLAWLHTQAMACAPQELIAEP